jgi:hypothetical protein
MDDATLERLMIDESLGVLDADVSTLLAAYTAQNPAASERANWQELAAKLRQAMPVATEQALPPLHLPASRHRQSWSHARSILALAAAIALGIGIGLWRAPATATSPPPAAQASAAAPAVSLPPPPANGQSFWSSKRLLAMAQSQKSESRMESARFTRPLGFEWLESQTQGVQ